MNARTFYSRGPGETRRIGEEIGRELKAGDVVCLSGELGAGKTCLAQGIARGLGVPEEECVRSPTFTILFSYQGKIPLHHFDFYRLSGEREAEELGLEEYFYGNGVCAIEWPERVGALLPEKRVEIHIQEQGENERKITLIVSPDSDMLYSGR